MIWTADRSGEALILLPPGQMRHTNIVLPAIRRTATTLFTAHASTLSPRKGDSDISTPHPIVCDRIMLHIASEHGPNVCPHITLFYTDLLIFSRRCKGNLQNVVW